MDLYIKTSGDLEIWKAAFDLPAETQKACRVEIGNGGSLEVNWNLFQNRNQASIRLIGDSAFKKYKFDPDVQTAKSKCKSQGGTEASSLALHQTYQGRVLR